MTKEKQWKEVAWLTEIWAENPENWSGLISLPDEWQSKIEVYLEGKERIQVKTMMAEVFDHKCPGNRTIDAQMMRAIKILRKLDWSQRRFSDSSTVFYISPKYRTELEKGRKKPRKNGFKVKKNR